jgi:hypothetical protein
MADSWRWMIDNAPDERSFYEAFLLWVYTARAHSDGTVDQIIEEAMAFPHQQSPEVMQRAIDAFRDHDLLDRLGEIGVPTLVIASDQDRATPPRLGREVAAAIPGTRFELMEGEAHQPFQEVPEKFNTIVDAFWREVDAGGPPLRFSPAAPRRGAGVVERGGLENRCARKRTESSNLSPSALQVENRGEAGRLGR